MFQYQNFFSNRFRLLVTGVLLAIALPFALAYSQERFRPNGGRSSGVPSKPSGRFVPRPAQSVPSGSPQAKSTKPNYPITNGQPNLGVGNKSTTGTAGIPAVAMPTAPEAKIAIKPVTNEEKDPRVTDKSKASSEDSIVVASEEEKNQIIAPDWERPWACLMLTGRQHGYIEPCGCTGLENQKGGLNRRDTLLTSLRNRGWDVLPIDTGDQVRRFGKQSEIKFSRTAEALKLMNYSAVMFGAEELKLSATDLFVALTDENGKQSSPFVGANISILMEGTPDPIKIINVGSKKIGITGIISDEMAKEIRSSDVTIAPAEQSLKSASAKLLAAECDFLILVAQASLEDTATLAKSSPIFDLVVTAGGYGEPYYKPEPIEGTKSVLLQVGVKGMYAGIVGLYDRPQNPIVYQRVALSSQFEDSPRIMELFARYQSELEQTEFDGLGLRPLSHPSTRQFAGTESCGECHTTAFEVWKNTPHAHATDSIINPPGRGQVARHFDPECLSCHVTGWNPQGFYPYVSGYASLTSTPHLTANGCENCHGPGADHVRAESGDTVVAAEVLTKLREQMRLPLSEAQDKCMECHDMDNSPNFHKDNGFQAYWEKVKHEGKD